MKDQSRFSDNLKDQARHPLPQAGDTCLRVGSLVPFSFKKDRLILLLLSLLIVGSWLPRMAGPIDLRWDGAVYYVLGTSLAEGKGYRLLNEPGEIEAIQYPPLLASFVAIHQIVLGTSDPFIIGRWLRLTSFCIYAALALATYVMLRHYLSVWVAFFGTLVFLSNVFTTFLSDLCFAEILFGLATVLTVLCMNCSRNSSSRFYGALAGVFAVAGFFLRTIGIALFAAWTIESLLRREFKKTALRLLTVSMAVLVWHTYVLHVQHSVPYTHPAYDYQRADYMFYNVSYAANLSLADPFRPELGKATLSQMAKRFTRNLIRMPVSLGEAVSAKQEYWKSWMVFRGQRFPILKMIPGWSIYIPLTLLGGIVLAGVALLAKEREVTVSTYIMVMLVSVCSTPWPDQFSRYWAPVMPFLVLALVSCLLALWQYCHTLSPKSVRWGVGGFIGLVLGLVVISGPYSQYLMYRSSYQKVQFHDENGGEGDYRLFFYGPGYRSLDAGLDWLKRQAEPNAIVAASMPQYAYLRTRLKAVMPPFEGNLEKAQNLLDSVPVTYLVLDFETSVNFAIVYMLPLVRSAPSRWVLVYSDEEGLLHIYKRVGLQDRRNTA